jgi:hypothetical protein
MNAQPRWTRPPVIRLTRIDSREPLPTRLIRRACR